MKLGDIAARLPASLVGDATLDIRRVVHPSDAEGPNDLAVALSKEALAAVGAQKAGAVLVAANLPLPAGRTVLTYAGNERVALAVLTAMFDAGARRRAGVDASAIVAVGAAVAESASIGARAVIGEGAHIGERTAILPNVTVGAGARIGADCVIHPGVVIGDRVFVGDRVIIHPNAVLGADGFSFIPARSPDGKTLSEMPVRIHSLGTVIIEDDVEIGAATTIDRATLRATRIGRGTKIDNQVQIGHNVTIGRSCLICGQVGIAGSVEIGDRVLIAAKCGFSDHVKVGDGAVVMAMSGVGMDVKPGEMVLGVPAVPTETWKQRYLQVGRLKRLYAQVAELKARLDALQKPSG